LKHPKLHKEINVSRSSLYYQQKQPSKDWATKQKIESILHEYPSYGHRRITLALKLNKKRISRVMKIYGIKPYRRHRKPWKRLKRKKNDLCFDGP